MRIRNPFMTSRPARRGTALLAGFLLLFFTAAGAAEEDIDLSELLDVDLEEIETVTILPRGESLRATDLRWVTPSDGSPVQCDHDNCYWNLNCGTWDEEAVWKVLTAPVTVLDYGERKQYKVRKEPSADAKTLTLLANGESYVVIGQAENYYEIQVDDDKPKDLGNVISVSHHSILTQITAHKVMDLPRDRG